MEQQQQQASSETPVVLSEKDQTEIVKNELALIPESERNDIMKVVKTDDIILIDSHKKKIKSFKARFPAKKYVITEDLVFSKDAYEKALEQWREVKNFRTKNAEPEFKKLKAPYVAITKFYNESTNPIISEYKAIEKPISDYVDALEALKKAEDEKVQRELEQRLNDRVAQVVAAGASFDSEFYSIGSDEFDVPSISLGIVDLQTMTDGIFENVLAQIIEKAAIISEAQAKKDEEARIVEEQRIAKEAAEKKLFEEQQAKLKKEQDDLAAEMAEFKRQKEELRLAQEKLVQDRLDEEDRLKQAELAKKEATKKERIQQLTAPGLHWDGSYYSLGYKHLKVHVSLTQIEELSIEDWDSKMNEVYAGITEQALLVKEDKEAADKKDAEDKIIADKSVADKAVADAKAKEEQDEINRQAELERQGDVPVWNDFISRLKAIEYPKMKSPLMASKVDEVKDFINGLK